MGEQASMDPHEADWIETGGCYGKARLIEVLLQHEFIVVAHLLSSAAHQHTNTTHQKNNS